jgi:hypothetical protein
MRQISCAASADQGLVSCEVLLQVDVRELVHRSDLPQYARAAGTGNADKPISRSGSRHHGVLFMLFRGAGSPGR